VRREVSHLMLRNFKKNIFIEEMAFFQVLFVLALVKANPLREENEMFEESARIVQGKPADPGKSFIATFFTIRTNIY